jgi:hypothetical protein
MISKAIMFLLLSALVCGAILAITTITIELQKNKVITVYDKARLDNRYPNAMLTGDGVGGGGTPRSGNQTI